MVRSKTFPYSMNELIEEVKAYEALNHISDEIKENSDAQGAQEDSEVLNQSLEELQRPIIDDGFVNDQPNQNDGKKFRPLCLQEKEQLLVETKRLVPEQRIVL